jgi:hypothetical protein
MHIKSDHLIKHETKSHQLKRFIAAFSVLIAYTLYLVWHYGSNGFSLGVITWSAFVLATPLPDGGVILDFPVRLLTGIRMVFSEIFVWIVAIGSNLYYLSEHASLYDKNFITASFKQILLNPWPDWIIIYISAAGTFLGLYFGDELLDMVFHHQRKKYARLKPIYQFILAIFAIAVLYFSYKYFLKLFGINI